MRRKIQSLELNDKIITKIQIDQSKHNHPPDHKLKQKKKTKGLKTKKINQNSTWKKKILN